MMGRRAILLTEFTEQLPANLPEGVRHFPYVPFSALLPRCAALVHHGGIGTTAQALRAGIPQLVTPMIFDQPDNAARVKRLGVGDSISPKRYTPGLTAERLTLLTSSSGVQQNCRQVAARFREGDPTAETCRWIESMLPHAWPAHASLEANHADHYKT